MQWGHLPLSGPLGGDAQIAELVLDRLCHKLSFFEDPHVARQHEADFQVLERAVCSAHTQTTCFNSPNDGPLLGMGAALEGTGLKGQAHCHQKRGYEDSV